MISASDMLNRLAARGLTLGCVESMTGGLFASTMCEVPGASHVFKGGIVAYSAEVKEKVAGVKEETIQKYGLVSREVAIAMASGGRKALGVDVCVSVTGNAGPDTEPGGKPVGEVHLGLAFQGNLWEIPLQLKGERNEIREQAMLAMISFVASLFPTGEEGIQFKAD